jgi:hypothetical protein
MTRRVCEHADPDYTGICIHCYAHLDRLEGDPPVSACGCPTTSEWHGAEVIHWPWCKSGIDPKPVLEE